MSLISTGAYLKRLREDAGVSRLGLSKKVDTSDSQIIRIERGQETRGSLLAKIITELQANPEDVVELLVSEGDGVDEGLARAEAWIRKRRAQELKSVAIHPDVERLLGQMTDYELGRWVGLGERILEERSKH